MKVNTISRRDRMRAIARVRLRGPGGESAALVVHATPRELRIVLPAPPAHGDIVDVLLGDQVLVGRVGRVAGTRCTVALAAPIRVGALLADGAMPLTIDAAGMALEETRRRSLAALLASDGPWPVRLLQAAAIVGLVAGGVATTLRIASLDVQPQRVLQQIAVASASVFAE